jgi:multidrug resistance efflux pump
MRKICVAVILILFITATACDGENKSTNTALIPPDMSAQPIEAFGVVKVLREEDIVLGFSAIVKDLFVKKGQKVKAGDALVALNTDEYGKQLEIKEYEMENLRRELEDMERDAADKKEAVRNHSHTQLKKLQNDLEKAKHEVDASKEELQAEEQLFSSGSISRAELEEYRKQVALKQSQVEDIVYSMEALMESLDEEIKGAEAKIQSERARLVLLDAEYGLMKSRSDCSFIRNNNIICTVPNGMISEINAVPGSYTGSQAGLLRIADLDSLIVEANVDEQFIANVRTGATASIIPEADREHKYRGKVVFIASEAVQSNGETTIPVQISIEAPDGFLLPNYNVGVRIEVEQE